MDGRIRVFLNEFFTGVGFDVSIVTTLLLLDIIY